MSNSFCRYLTNGVRIQTWGNNRLAAAPCCYLPMTEFDDPKYNLTFDQYRKKPTCDACLGFVSGDTQDPSYPPNRALRLVQDVEHHNPVYAELSLDNKCNAACLSCSDSFSTLWEEQNKKFKIKTADDYPDAQDNKKVVADLFKKFNFANLEFLNFLGGEPLISTTTFLFLERLVEMEVSKNIEILFTTNGSVKITNEKNQLLKNFKKVNFSYSIDSVDERFHYLRYPLDWGRVTENISTTKLLGYQANINITVGALNAFYLDEITEWCQKTSNTNVIFVPCAGIMSVNSLPKAAHTYLRHKYKNNNKISRIFRLNFDDTQSITNFLNYTELWDQRRNLNWKQVFPLAVPYFENYK